MVRLPDDVTLGFLIGDFESTWNALASQNDSRNRGNFLFSLMAMVLLEVASRLCSDSGKKAQALKNALKAREPRYFTKLPGRSGKVSIKLPSTSEPRRRKELLYFMFDAIRNGLAHEYGQKETILSDGELHFVLTGATRGTRLDERIPQEVRDEHLSYRLDGRNLWIKVRTDVLFVDIRESIRGAGLEHWKMARLKSHKVKALVEDVRASLDDSGHKAMPIEPVGPGVPGWKATTEQYSSLSPTGMAVSTTMPASGPSIVLRTKLAPVDPPAAPGEPEQAEALETPKGENSALSD